MSALLIEKTLLDYVSYNAVQITVRINEDGNRYA